MKRVPLILLIAAALPLTSLAAQKDHGPEVMNMKERFQVEGSRRAAIFPHRMHQAKLECASCHQNPEGGGKLKVEFVKKTGLSNDFHKKFCWPCHDEMQVPKGKACSTCHE